MTARKRRLAAAGVLSVLLLSGGSTASGAATITVMTNPYIKGATDEIAKAFQLRAPGTTVNVVMSPRDNDQALQKLLLDSLTGRPLPDVVVVNGNLTRAMADRDLARPLPRQTPATDVSARSNIELGSKQYGLAFGLSMPVVLINSKLLAEAGLSEAQVPDDWKGILAIARKIGATHPGIIGGFIEHDSSGAYDFITLVESFGGRMMSPDERHITFGGPAGRQALEVLKGFGEAGQAKNDMSNRQARQAFDAGAIGILVTVSSAIPPAAQMANKDFHVIVKPFPVQPGGRLPMAGPVLVMLSKDASQRRASMDFMNFASGDAGEAMLAEGSGYIPNRPAAIAFSNLPTNVKSEYGALLKSRLGVATPWYAFPGFNSVEISRLIEDDLELVVTLEMAPDNALRSMESNISPLLPQVTAGAR